MPPVFSHIRPTYADWDAFVVPSYRIYSRSRAARNHTFLCVSRACDRWILWHRSRSVLAAGHKCISNGPPSVHAESSRHIYCCMGLRRVCRYSGEPLISEVRPTICTRPYDVYSTQWIPLLPFLLPDPGNSATHKENNDLTHCFLQFPMQITIFPLKKLQSIKSFRLDEAKVDQLTKHNCETMTISYLFPQQRNDGSWNNHPQSFLNLNEWIVELFLCSSNAEIRG